MSKINNLSEAWNGHAYKEVEDFIKKHLLTGESSADSIEKLFRDMGRTAIQTLQPLSVGQSGCFVNTSGTVTQNANLFAVSAPLSLTAGRIYLLKSSVAVGASVAVFSRVFTGTEEVAIEYAYTYDSAGKPMTAIAKHDTSLVYTFHYDAEGGLENITNAAGATVDHLPATRAVAYTRYQPLFFSGHQLPDSGYYIYLCIEDQDIVVSARTADINGQSLTAVHYDVFTAIAYALNDRVAKDGDEPLVTAHALAALDARIASLEEKLASGFGSITVDNLTVRNSLNDYSTEGNANGSGEGAPSFIPDKAGQRYLDTATRIWYTATGCKAVSDWKPDTNA